MTKPGNLPANYVTGNAFPATAENSVETAVNWLLNNGAIVVAAPTGNATTDTTNIQNAINAAGANGWVILQAGAYLLSATGLTIANGIRLSGCGEGGTSGTGGTMLYTTSATCTAITINANGVTLEDFNLLNASGAQATAGYGIAVGTSGGNGIQTKINRIQVYNFYDNIRMVNGYYWQITGCHIYSPARYGIFASNPAINVDAGDNIISHCIFDMTNAFGNAAAAVRFESGDGLRVCNSKINGSGGHIYPIGVDVVPGGASGGPANMGEVFIHDMSIETCTTGIRAAILAGSFIFGMLFIHDIEFETSTAVVIGAGIGDVNIHHLYGLSGSIGVDLQAGSRGVAIGENWWDSGFNPAIRISSTSVGPTWLAKQHFVAAFVGNPSSTAGTIVTDATSYTTSAACVDYRYKIPIDWTVSGTPATCFTLGVASNQGGQLTVTVTGLENTIGPIAIKTDRYYAAGPTGTMTTTTNTNTSFNYGGGTTTIGFTLTANTITIVLTGSNAVAGGLVDIVVNGSLTSFSQGG